MEKQRVAIFIDGSNLYHNLKRYDIKTTFEEIIKRIGKFKVHKNDAKLEMFNDTTEGQ